MTAHAVASPTADVVPALVRKEARALLPVWLLTAGSVALAVSLGGELGPAAAELPAVAPWLVMAAALGAVAIGHEFQHGTLGLLLAQPVARRRVLAIKLGVLATMSLPLVGIAAAIGGARDAALVVAVGLLLTPSLTLICRSALSGLALALSVPAVLWATGHIAAGVRYGWLSTDPAQFAAYREAWLWWGTVATAFVASAWLRRTFVRLEAIDAGGASGTATVTPTAWSPAARGWSRAWPIQLVRKELHLYLLVYWVTALYVLIWAALVFGPTDDIDITRLLRATTDWFILLVPLLIGALSCAEERSHGTVAMQLLLPVPLWRQWLVKLLVVAAVSLVVAEILPSVLPSVEVSAWLSGAWSMAHWRGATLPIMAAATYVSSWSGVSGLRALALSMALTPIFLSGLGGVDLLADLVGPWFEALARSTVERESVLGMLRTLWRIQEWLTLGICALLFLFAMRAYARTDREPWRLARQVLIVAAGIGVLTLVKTAEGALRVMFVGWRLPSVPQ